MKGSITICTIFDKFYMIFQSELFCFLREADNPLFLALNIGKSQLTRMCIPTLCYVPKKNKNAVYYYLFKINELNLLHYY